MRRFIFLIAIAVGISALLRMYVFEAASVASGSMEPTLFIGGHYWINRMVYRFREPRRGEIISFVSPVDHHSKFIKRVIAIPGDEVELRSKQVVINHAAIDEPYAVHSRPGSRLVGDDLGPLKVPERCVFVLGDNRDESFDSSIWKDSETGQPIYFLSFDQIRGRLIQIP